MSFSQLFWLIPNFKPVNPLFTNLYKPIHYHIFLNYLNR
jgi:hypothetical protein